MGSAKPLAEVALSPEATQTFRRLVDGLVDKELAAAVTDVDPSHYATLRGYARAARALSKAHHEVPFRAAFGLIRSTMAHTIA